MGKELLLVGSVPLDTVEEVMSVFGARLGRYLPAMPDGEVGERRSWVNRFCYLLFNGHADLETLKRPPSVDGLETLLPRKRDETWEFRVRPGVKQVRFGLPGLRLRYAHEATSSYFVFKTLREKGALPKDLRFQISIPTVDSVIRPLYFPAPEDLAKLRPGFEESLAAELEVIVRRIPAKDLAIQWDMGWELSAAYGGWDASPTEAKIETHMGPIRRLSALLPKEAAIGFHFCFGTFGGWPAFSPPDLGRAVDLVNAAVSATGRAVQWVHIPTLDRKDPAFYAPLSKLDVGQARLYLGMIHSMASFGERLAVIRDIVPDFGLAAYCGFGRTPPEQLQQILQDHLKALALAGKS